MINLVVEPLLVGFLSYVNVTAQVFNLWLILCQVEEEAGKKGTTTFADFKRAVWHESFKKLLETIKYHSKTGFMIVCSDGVERCLFPFIVILSADYEEQYVRFPLITKLPNNISDV